MVGVWDVCPCMDNVFRDMQIGDCPTGVLVSYSISNRLCVPTPSACAKPDPLLDSSAVRLKALLRGRYNMIIGLTTNAYIVEGSVDIDIYSTDISIFEEHGVLIRGLYNVTTGSHLSDTDTVRLHSAYFDGSQAGDAPTATCAGFSGKIIINTRWLCSLFCVCWKSSTESAWRTSVYCRQKKRLPISVPTLEREGGCSS